MATEKLELEQKPNRRRSAAACGGCVKGRSARRRNIRPRRNHASAVHLLHPGSWKLKGFSCCSLAPLAGPARNGARCLALLPRTLTAPSCSPPSSRGPPTGIGRRRRRRRPSAPLHCPYFAIRCLPAMEATTGDEFCDIRVSAAAAVPPDERPQDVAAFLEGGRRRVAAYTCMLHAGIVAARLQRSTCSPQQAPHPPPPPPPGPPAPPFCCSRGAGQRCGGAAAAARQRPSGRRRAGFPCGGHGRRGARLLGAAVPGGAGC